MSRVHNVLSVIIEELEGVYSDDPRDKGGQTVYGIARNYNKEWDGWDIVDNLLLMLDRDDLFDPDEELVEIVKAIQGCPEVLDSAAEYLHQKYYAGTFCEKLPEPMNWLFYDMNINMGKGGAIKVLQQAINYYHDNKNIMVDGAFGARTEKAFKNTLLDLRFYMQMRNARLDRYSHLGEKQSHYLRGWINRCVKFNKWLDNQSFGIVQNPHENTMQDFVDKPATRVKEGDSVLDAFVASGKNTSAEYKIYPQYTLLIGEKQLSILAGDALTESIRLLEIERPGTESKIKELLSSDSYAILSKGGKPIIVNLGGDI